MNHKSEQLFILKGKGEGERLYPFQPKATLGKDIRRGEGGQVKGVRLCLLWLLGRERGKLKGERVEEGVRKDFFFTEGNKGNEGRDRIVCRRGANWKESLERFGHVDFAIFLPFGTVITSSEYCSSTVSAVRKFMGSASACAINKRSNGSRW